MSRDSSRWIAILLAVAGTGICVTSLVSFVVTIVQNDLPWSPGQTIREHYIAVGESYSQGFTVGFFLCFSLIVLAVSAAALVERRRRVLRATNRGVEPRPAHQTR